MALFELLPAATIAWVVTSEFWLACQNLSFDYREASPTRMLANAPRFLVKTPLNVSHTPVDERHAVVQEGIRISGTSQVWKPAGVHTLDKKVLLRSRE